MEAPGQLQIYVKDSVTGAARSGLSIETEDDEVSVRRTEVPRFQPRDTVYAIFAGHNDNRNFVLRITVAGGLWHLFLHNPWFGGSVAPSSSAIVPSSLRFRVLFLQGSHRAAISSQKMLANR